MLRDQDPAQRHRPQGGRHARAPHRRGRGATSGRARSTGPPSSPRRCSGHWSPRSGAAIEAVRTFVDTVDTTLPSRGEAPSKRQDVIDSALKMADRLVHVQYDFLRKVVADAGRTVSGSLDRK